MNKSIILTLIIGIFLIGLASAAVTTTLNQPADGSTQYNRSVNMNCSTSVDIAGRIISNISLFTKVNSGSWLLNQTINSVQPPLTTQAHGIAYVSTRSDTAKLGMKVTIGGTNVRLTNVTKDSTTTATKAYVLDGNGITQATSTFIGNQAPFDLTLIANNNYSFVVDNNGAAYTEHYNGAVGSYPVSNTYLTWISDSNGATNTARDVISVTLEGFNSVTQVFNNNYTAGTNVTWNCQGKDSSGTSAFAGSNYTFTIDSVAPVLYIPYPTNPVGYAKIGGNLTIKFRPTDVNNLDSCWVNYGGINSSIACSTGVFSYYNLTLTSQNNFTLYANDTVGNLGSAFVSWNYSILENNRTLNSTAYETSFEGYSLNVTANSSLTAVFLNYNGVEYPTTYSNGLWTFMRDLPSSAIGNNSITYRLVYGGNNVSTDYTYQNVQEINFGLCNATLTVPFINFSFKDENTLANLNATLQSASWDYYLGLGTQTKSFVYSTTSNASKYAFCFSPTDRLLHASPSITYSATNYPARFYEPGVLSLTNTTTNQVLYLLSSSDGIYVTFITVTQSNTPVAGADILITREISGNTTIVAQGTTDGAGSYTAWLNPNFLHTISASKFGFGSNTQSVKPTQSTYTLILTSSSNFTYVSNFDGLQWGIFPMIGFINNSVTNYGFNISSLNGNVVGCQIQLLDINKEKTVLSTATTIATNSSYCSVQTSYNPVANGHNQIKGRLLVDIGQGYQILEEDPAWIYLAVNSTGLTFTDWFHSINASILGPQYFNNDLGHQQYTYVVAFFLIAMLLICVINFSGFDFASPGSMIIFMTILIYIASFGGFLDLTGSLGTPFDFVNKYFIAILATMFCIGYIGRQFTQ